MKFNLKNGLIAGSFVFAGLLAGCQVPTSMDANPTNQSATVPAEFSVSSADWIDPKQEDAIASTAKVTRLAPDVYKMVFTIDYDSLKKAGLSYQGLDTAYFVRCVSHHVGRLSQKRAYYYFGTVENEPSFEVTTTQKSPFTIYLGLSDKGGAFTTPSHPEISWTGPDDSPQTERGVQEACKVLFPRY